MLNFHRACSQSKTVTIDTAESRKSTLKVSKQAELESLVFQKGENIVSLSLKIL